MKKDFHMDQNSQLEQRIRDCAAEDRRLQREIEIRERAVTREHNSSMPLNEAEDDDDEFGMERVSHSKNKERHRTDKHRRHDYS